jgi:hypothetical protein
MSASVALCDSFSVVSRVVREIGIGGISVFPSQLIVMQFTNGFNKSEMGIKVEEGEKVDCGCYRKVDE